MQFLFKIDPDPTNRERRDAKRAESKRILELRKEEEELERSRLREFKEKRGTDAKRGAG